MGLVDGVTTNPTLLAKEGRGFRATIREICAMVEGPVSAEVVSAHSAAAMLQEARTVASWHKNVVVKVPFCPEGIKVIRQLSAEGIRTNVTLMFSLTQAHVAAKAGGTFLSLFVGRVDDMASEGMEAVRDAVAMVRTYGFQSEVLVASVRHPLHIVEALRAGAQIATVPYKTLQQMIQHPLTDSGLARFTDDWKKAGLNFD